MQIFDDPETSGAADDHDYGPDNYDHGHDDDPAYEQQHDYGHDPAYEYDKQHDYDPRRDSGHYYDYNRGMKEDQDETEHRQKPFDIHSPDYTHDPLVGGSDPNDPSRKGGLVRASKIDWCKIKRRFGFQYAVTQP